MVVAVPKFTPALARLPCDLCQGDNPVVLLRRVCVPQARAESKPVYISVYAIAADGGAFGDLQCCYINLRLTIPAPTGHQD